MYTKKSIDLDHPEWTVSYFKQLNEELKKLGLSEMIIDGNIVYKDELHKFLGIGIELEDK